MPNGRTLTMQPSHTIIRPKPVTHASIKRRTQPRVKRRRALTPLEAAILILCLLSLIAVFARDARADARPHVSTASVRVSASQTLWDLATEHPIEGLTTAETVEHIKDLNDLPGSQLAEGQELEVPVADHELAALASR